MVLGYLQMGICGSSWLSEIGVSPQTSPFEWEHCNESKDDEAPYFQIELQDGAP